MVFVNPTPLQHLMFFIPTSYQQHYVLYPYLLTSSWYSSPFKPIPAYFSLIQPMILCHPLSSSFLLFYPRLSSFILFHQSTTLHHLQTLADMSDLVCLLISVITLEIVWHQGQGLAFQEKAMAKNNKNLQFPVSRRGQRSGFAKRDSYILLN